MEEKKMEPKNLKEAADMLKVNPDETIVDISFRLPAYEASALKLAANIDDKSINQWVRDSVVQSINVRTEPLLEIQALKAYMHMLKEKAKTKNKSKEKGISMER